MNYKNYSKPYIPIVAILLLLSGCLTSRKAEKQLDKIQAKFPSMLPTLCDTLYPAITTSTDTLVFYDWLEVPCPEMGTDTAIAVTHPTTGKKTVTVKVKVPIYHITITKESTAKIKIVETRIQKFERIVKWKTTAIWVLLSLFLVSGFLNWYLIRRK